MPGLSGGAGTFVKDLGAVSGPATTARWDSRLILTSCWPLRPLTRSWRSCLETSVQAPETIGAQNSLMWSSGRDFPCLLQQGLMVTSQRLATLLWKAPAQPSSGFSEKESSQATLHLHAATVPQCNSDAFSCVLSYSLLKPMSCRTDC